MSFSVRGEAKVNSILSNLAFHYRRGVLQGGHHAINIVVNRARIGMLNGPHTGRKWPNLPNQSSASGEYAANQSGTMLDSIKGTASIFQMRISATAPHAGYVEYGTIHMHPRPVIANAAADTREQVYEILERYVWREIS